MDFQSHVHTSDIEYAVKGFISGYHSCNSNGSHITIAVGTSNSGDNVSYEHGQAWGEMIKRLDGWIKSPPSWGDTIEVVAAIDIEPSWNTSNTTLSWIDGYDSVSGRKTYYNVGTCDSCPYRDHTDWTPAGYSWSLDQIWYVTYGDLYAMPLPEIYAEDVWPERAYHAWQWQNLKYWAKTCTNCLPESSPYRGINFLGSLTQYQACQENLADTCYHQNNTPQQGWTLFWNALNSSSITAQGLRWSTDISW